MIYIPIRRSLETAQRIKRGSHSKRDIKRARDATTVATTYYETQAQAPIIMGTFVLQTVSPFHNQIPLIPWL